MGSESENQAELRIRWSAGAQSAFSATLERIHAQDQPTPVLIAQRVKRALDILVLQPEIGTVVMGTQLRRLAIPKTGHLIDYEVRGQELFISRWARSTRQPMK